ncbi:MAG: hypothetical protein BWY44_01234 [Candidatus Omnitrophica bacterium ADurb.Bin292]|nr:MAG: hypothetical protein BWY44_01234 [Candidatus Omnitrophica bacterium ADurb.Bin292]
MLRFPHIVLIIFPREQFRAGKLAFVQKVIDHGLIGFGIFTEKIKKFRMERTRGALDRYRKTGIFFFEEFQNLMNAALGIRIRVGVLDVDNSTEFPIPTTCSVLRTRCTIYIRNRSDLRRHGIKICPELFPEPGLFQALQGVHSGQGGGRIPNHRRHREHGGQKNSDPLACPGSV